MSQQALLIIDMQQATAWGSPKHDFDAVVLRINALTGRMRERGSHIVFVQHDGKPGDDFEPGTSGWPLLESLQVRDDDIIVHKSFNDAFFHTELEHVLRAREVRDLRICGWATDFCVDATVRSAAALGFEVTVVGDAHTLSDRAHLSAEQIIEHHQAIWRGLICAEPVRIEPAAEL